MNHEELARLAQLAATDAAPQARALDPEVRSGASFTFGNAAPGAVAWPRFEVVWFFTVAPANRDQFATNVAALEAGAIPAPPGVTYFGTYSVAVSSAAPDYEYRMVWGLTDLSGIQALNNMLNGASVGLRACLDLIAQVPVMRTEILGRTAGSAKLAKG
jgi:hypothetical protein